MTPEESKLMEEFVNRCKKRHNKANKKYKDAWRVHNLFKDMEEELLDLANYAAYQWIKIQKLKRR